MLLRRIINYHIILLYHSATSTVLPGAIGVTGKVFEDLKRTIWYECMNRSWYYYQVPCITVIGNYEYKVSYYHYNTE
jgi:hypothetical protein